MIRDVNEISDEEYNKIVIPFDKSVKKYVRENFLNEFIAYYISECYKQEVLWTQEYHMLVNSALEELGQFRYKDSNFKKIKNILEKKHHLKIVNNSPKELIEIEEIN
ncbi:MAG: hypothetical protein IJ068_00375 [Bacilli bacterium]|nr:hypothetical protein [Bacilli bacterium]